MSECCGNCRYGSPLSLHHPDLISCGLHEGAVINDRNKVCELHKPKDWPRDLGGKTDE